MHQHGDDAEGNQHASIHGEDAWDERYREQDRIWSGNPNPVLVAEVSSLPPGTALDAGAGEGGDAIWLAERGWRVVGVDVSGVALARAAEHAGERGVDVDWQHVDLSEQPAPGTYDLVTAHYLHLPRQPRQAVFAHLAQAVAPGGTLLVVGHDFSDMAVLPRPGLAEMGWGLDEVIDPLGAGWTIEVAEIRPRPATDVHADAVTVHDAVVRARRAQSIT